jgi:inner membrane protein
VVTAHRTATGYLRVLPVLSSVENLTHSLLGATLAEATLPLDALPAQRRTFYVTGILAANLPDADLIYTSITTPPLGYLLHHRGHTHTVVGLLGLAALFTIAFAIPSIRRSMSPIAGRFWLLVVAALASHLIADGWNSYGVHPFYPVDNRWFYGDAVNIFEPWLWVLLGTAVAMNARSTTRRTVIAGFIIAISLAAAAFRVIDAFVLAPIGVVASLLVLTLRRLRPSSRAVASLCVVAVFVTVSYVLGAVARAEAVASVSHSGASVVDVVLAPRPGNLLCWNALLIQREDDALVMRRANIPIAHRWLSACRASGIEWPPIAQQSIAQLKGALADCRTRAWLQFGRAPAIRGSWIADLRFGDPARGNFSGMAMPAPPSNIECPRHITHWAYPRADILLSDR